MASLNLDQLKEVDHSLYVVVSKASGHTTGIHEINIDQLKAGYRARAARWAVVTSTGFGSVGTVVLLPNGEPRLPLDVAPNKNHSTAQLKDWLARTRR